jgi:hypothetical protein
VWLRRELANKNARIRNTLNALYLAAASRQRLLEHPFGDVRVAALGMAAAHQLHVMPSLR